MIGDEARAQALAAEGGLPARVIACVGGGSNSIGTFVPFLDDDVELIGVEAGGEGLESGRHGASLTAGRTGVLHGALSSVLADDEGQILEAHSVSAGLDYPGVGPQHAQLRDSGRVRYLAVTDDRGARGLRRARPARGDHPGAGALARDRLAAGEPGLTGARSEGYRRPHPERAGRQGPGRGRRAPRRWLNDRIAAAFAAAALEGRAALMPYMMGGFPDRETSAAVAEAYADAGADLVELGVPYSDPLADGPVIHAAGTRALWRRGDARLGARRLRADRRRGSRWCRWPTRT